MSNANKYVVIAYFDNDEQATNAGSSLKDWDKANDSVKLGGIGVITMNEKGKLKTHLVGTRSEGYGFKYGAIIGGVAGLLSGGATVLGAAAAGAVAGWVIGAFFHKRLGLSDEDKALLDNHLEGGGAALVAMADDFEVEPTQAYLANMGATVESYHVPEETMDELEAYADAAEDSVDTEAAE